MVSPPGRAARPQERTDGALRLPEGALRLRCYFARARLAPERLGGASEGCGTRVFRRSVVEVGNAEVAGGPARRPLPAPVVAGGGRRV